MRYFLAAIILIIIASAPFWASANDNEIATTSPENHQPIKAEVIDSSPENYTIDVHSLSNLGVDENADTFAVYTASSLPKTCGDFSDTDLSYNKPEKYKRSFDLSENPEVLSAIEQYQCVIVPNKPA